MMTACLLALFSNSDITGYKLLAAPIFVQEIVIAVWLLVKGFSPSHLPPRTASESPTGTTTLSGTKTAGAH